MNHLVASLSLRLVRGVQAVSQDLDLLAEILARSQHPIEHLASTGIDLVSRDPTRRPWLGRTHDRHDIGWWKLPIASSLSPLSRRVIDGRRTPAHPITTSTILGHRP